jgi:hypothetical protein
LGCQRFVWCPKWTPASKNCLIEMTAIKSPYNGLVKRPMDEIGLTGSYVSHKETGLLPSSLDKQFPLLFI